MKKVLIRIFLSLIAILISFMIYTMWDNQRIKVVEQDIVIENLPEQLEGFSIIQITDLHEKEFGKNQKRLIRKINAIDYDVIAFTGDILDGVDSTNYESLYKILEGINHKEHMFFVPGNSDPASYELTPAFEKSAFITGMEEKGLQYLESFDSIEVDDATVNFVNFELAIIENPEQIGNINGVFRPHYADEEVYQIYQQELWEEMKAQDVLNSSDVLIALNHYPIVDVRFDYIENDSATDMKDFDLILAGHYHGGQIRLPFMGALFVPEPWYEPNSFFPPQDRVKGLWEYNGINHYVSAGLGSSESISFLKFRMFNPPEINVLTLKGSSK
jgi:predicted MPP superfamily phosphohydrolase